MVMIRCPDCGQRVLDIATSCPQCHRVLIQNPLETHNWSALQECGRCHKHIERDAPVCPYCGHRVRAAQIAARTVGAFVAVVVLVAAGFAAWRSGVVDTITGAFGASRPEPQAQVQAPTAVPDTLGPMGAEPAEFIAAPIVAAAPQDSTPAQVVTPSPPPPAATQRAAVPPPSGLVRRWVREWANVRTERDTTSAIVRVLSPNAAVDVADLRQGWWALYLEGAFVGYIANSLLRAEPSEL